MIASKLVIIFGPTSSGKTALSLKLAKYIFGRFHIECEIVSADSRQIYRGMDIGTAKVDTITQERFVHHLLNVLPPTQQYSSQKFQRDAKRLIQEIWLRGRLPMVVGGTGTFVMGLVGDKYIKNAIQRDSEAYQSLLLVPEFERQTLYRKVEANVDKMFRDGLYAETKRIISDYHGVPKQLGKTHGYREFIEYAKQHHKNVFRLNEVDLAKIKYRIKVDTKRYAMHQSAWLNKITGYHLVDGIDQAKALVDNFLSAS